MDDEQRYPKVADALRAWRDAERDALRATAQREAAELAATARLFAEKAAQSTSRAADAAILAAIDAARTATATFNAAHKVTLSAVAERDACRVQESDALAAEEEAKAAHKSASDHAYELLRRGPGGGPGVLFA